MKYRSTLSKLLCCLTLLLLSLSSCKKDSQNQPDEKKLSTSSLIDIAKESLNKQSIQGKTLINTFASIGMIPDWSKAKTRMNSKNKTVLAVPLEKTANSFSELNMVETGGIAHNVIKKYTTLSDGSIQLDFFALDGNLLKTGWYNSLLKTFRPSRSLPLRASLFAPHENESYNVGSNKLLANTQMDIASKINTLSFSASSTSGGKNTDDLDKGDNEDLKEVVIVGERPTPPPPPEDPFYVPELPTGPTDTYPTDPVVEPGGGGNEAAPTLILSLADRAKYPILAQVIDKLYQKAKNDPKLMEALKKFSHLSEKQILDNLIPGRGPAIVVTKLSGSIYGHYDYPTNTIQIDETTASNVNYISNNVSSALELFLTITVLHEFIHFGENYTQIFLPHNGSADDVGFQFENEQFGGMVSYNTNGTITFEKIK